MTDDLNDSLDDLLGGAVTGPAKLPPASYQPRDFSEPCPKCRGRGQFIGYSGRVLGPCFACKGVGKRTFKTSPEQRAKHRESSARRAEVKRIEKEQDRKAWCEEHAAEVTWLNVAAERQRENAHKGRKVWNFPIELSEKLAQYGHLTEGQLEGVRKCIARDAERAKERKANEASAKAIDISKVEASFAHAREAAAEDGEGIKWLKLCLDTFTFSDAPARGDWPAAIFVKEGAIKLGRIVGGKFIRSFACDDATEARVLAAAADPAAAATAFGLRTGVCGCCGRELTNAESRERGIGPICAQKYGW